MGKPAARVGDMHTCPLVNPGVPPPPHVGGPVLPPGELRVLIESMPAARVGDMATCAGPPDTIAMGSPTVLIGGRPAARLGDTTAHGGVIVVGCPTVLIGDGGGGGGGSGGSAAAPAGASAGAGADSDPSSAEEGGVAEIQQLIDEGRKQEAIDAAVSHFGIDTSNVPSLQYDPSVSGEAEASKDGSVRVGDAAFRSPGWVGSSLAHEIEVHVDEQAAQGKWYTGPQGTAVQEVEAYDHEIANAERFGLTDAEVADLESRRTSYYDQLDGDHQSKVDSNDYDMNPGEERR